MGQKHSSHSSLEVTSSSNIDEDETWFLQGEVELLTAKWKRAAEVPKCLQGLRAKEIDDPPAVMRHFVPQKTSSRIHLEKDSTNWERFLAANTANDAPVRGRKRKELPAFPCDCCERVFECLDFSEKTVQKLCRHKAYLPRPKTPEQYWNPAWWSQDDQLNKTQ